METNDPVLESRVASGNRAAALAMCVYELEKCTPEDRDLITRALRSLYRRRIPVLPGARSA